MRVFISYAHASVSHRDAVGRLWSLLRSGGIDAILDRPYRKEQEWLDWMQRQINLADYVLIIASAAYVSSADWDPEAEPERKKGRGVYFEFRFLRQKIFKMPAWSHRVIAVLLPGETADGVPDFFEPHSRTHYKIPHLTEKGVVKLVNDLLDREVELIPPLGEPIRSVRAVRSLRPPSMAPHVPTTDTVLHLGPLTPDLPSTQRSAWRESLLADIKETVYGFTAQPTLVVAASGVTRTGSNDEFDEARELLVTLAELLQLSRDRFVIMPSPVDVAPTFWTTHRTRVDHRLATRQCDGWPEGTLVADLLRNFYGNSADAPGFSDTAPWQLLEVPDDRLLVIGVNCFLRDCASGSAQIGRRQLEWLASALGVDRDGWLTLAVMGRSPNPVAGWSEGQEFIRRLGPQLHCIFSGAPDQADGSDVPGLASFGSLGLVGLPDNAYQLVEIPRHKQRLRALRRAEVPAAGPRRWRAHPVATPPFTDWLSLAAI